jgi:hypothetical protein
MKECEQIGDLLSELHDQELESEIEKAAREHLHNCSCCREEFKWYGITVQALTHLERVQPPNDFLQQLHVRLHACSPSYSFLHSFRNLLSTLPQLPVPVGATALALVVAVAWAVYSYAPPVTLPTGGMKSIAYLPTGAAENVDVTQGGVWQTTPNTRPDRIMARTQESAPLGRADGRSFMASRSPATAKSLTPTPFSVPFNIKTVGSDNLTVESPSINLTVESLKRALPNLHGRLVEEQSRDGMRETVLAVSIPPQSWPHLTTELISHGAVAVASDATHTLPEAEARENRNVLIRIRIVNTR